MISCTYNQHFQQFLSYVYKTIEHLTSPKVKLWPLRINIYRIDKKGMTQDIRVFTL